MTSINPFGNFFTSVSDSLAKMGAVISTGVNDFSNDLKNAFSFSDNLNRNDSFSSSSIKKGNNAVNYSFSGVIDTGIIGRSQSLAAEGLKRVSPQELKELGQRQDKTAFFKALLPAALESERKYGVPASVTLAQAALESGWAKSPIGGYNIFGIKGKGPAGTVNVQTKEYLNGKWVTIRDNFAKYNNFYEAVMNHGKVFHGGYKGYERGLDVYKRTGDAYAFIKAAGPTYATSPSYSRDIQKIMQDYDLVNMAKKSYVI
ncbi:MAG: glucosaminidase domain-containing protein [Candidatus Sericytochromatia bacterium]